MGNNFWRKMKPGEATTEKLDTWKEKNSSAVSHEFLILELLEEGRIQLSDWKSVNCCPYCGDMDHPLLGCPEFLPRTIKGVIFKLQKAEDWYAGVEDCGDKEIVGDRPVATPKVELKEEEDDEV